MKATHTGNAAAKGQATELETQGEVNAAEHLALLADISTSRGFNAVGEEWVSNITMNRATPLQHHDSSTHTAFDDRRHNSTDIVQNRSARTSIPSNEPLAVESPQAEEKMVPKKRKSRPDEELVGPESTGIRRSQPIPYWERSQDEQPAGPSTRVNADRHASAFETRSVIDQFQQSALLSALNTYGMPRDPVSILRSEREMLNAYAAAIVGPVHPMQPSNLAAALRQQQTARVATALQIFTANPAAGLVPIQSTSERPAIPHPNGAYGVPLISPMLIPQGFPVAPALLLQQHLNPTINLMQLYQQYQHLLSPNHFNGLRDGSALLGGGVVAQHALAADREASIRSYGESSLPVVLFMANDETKLSSYQILLRQQIEAFAASEDDVASHARGRNKPITLRQVGIRCRHCSRTTWNRREKGSAYFPHSLQGLYQAAQNMGSSHFNDPICSQMPAELQKRFAVTVACKSSVGSGKHYWADSARKLGLVDTDRGIRTIFDVLNGVL